MHRSLLRPLGLLLISLGAFAQGQGQSKADAVRALNNRVLQFHAALGQANASEQAQIRSQAGPVVSQRASAMVDLIKQDPSTALGLAFSRELREQLAKEFPAVANSLEEHGTWSGTSDHLIFDDPARSVRRYQVSVQSASGILEVYSAKGEPHCVSGNTLTSEGIKVNNVVAAGSTSVSGASTTAAASCSTIGPQNTAVILVTFPGVNLPAAVTPSLVNDIFFANTGRSVNTFWQEGSYGLASATGQVFGPYALSQVYTCDQYSAMRTAAIAAADPYVDFTKYTRVFVVFPDPGGCGWAGLGSLGCGSLSSADGTFQASSSWLLATYMGSIDNGVRLATHEGGHNLTLHHASSRDFGAEALGAPGAAGTLDEYGDPFSTMGSWNFGHYSAQHKVQMGWLTSSNVATVETPGTFSILPFEPSTLGIQALKIRRGTTGTSWLWLEYRQPTGLYSSTLPSQIFGGALAHYQDDTTGTHTHLIDFTPGTTTFSDPALTGAWTDPYTNLDIAVTGATSAALTVNVGYRTPTCDARVAPTVTLSPNNPTVTSGSSYGFNVSITNHDSTGCAASTFALSSAQPAGVTTTFASNTLTITPGQTLSTTMTKAVPAGYTPGTYPVDVRALDSTHDVTATNNLTVVAPVCVSVAPTVTLSPASVSLLRGATQVYTVTVKNNEASPCAARTFSLSSTLPSGWASSFALASLTLSAGATGSTTMTKTVPTTAPLGANTVNATASDASHTVTANATATVVDPITVTLSAVPTTVAARSNVTLTATVLNASNAPVSGATVTFNITRGGASSSSTVTTNSSGVATLSYRAQQKGNYSATATASYSGATATSNTVTFTAQ